MMTLRTIYCFFLVHAFLFCCHGQEEFYFFSPNFQISPCPYDNSIVNLRPVNYEVYQTEDDTPSGVRIEKCYSFSGNAISSDELELERPLFIKVDTAFNDILVFENTTYSIFGFFGHEVINSCDNRTCTMAHITYDFVDQNGDHQNYTVTLNQSGFFGDVYDCFGTPNGSNVFIKDITFETFLEDKGSSYDVRISPVDMAMTFGGDLLIQDAFVSFPDPTQSFVSIIPGDLVNRPGAPSVLVVNTSQEFSPDFPSVKTIHLNPNPSTQKHIVIEANFGSALVFQPYTEIRGGLVAGSDTLRHLIDIIVDGGNLCLNGVDLLVSGGSSFRYKGGHIDFTTLGSCLNIKQESKLVLEKRSVMQLGHLGSGLLSLSDGEVLIEEGASLWCSGQIILNGKIGSSYVTLKPGSSLSFDANSSFRRVGVATEKLIVYGYEDQVDLGELPLEYHDYIEIRSPNHPIKGEVLAYPNPCKDFLYLNDYNGEVYTIYTMQGNELLEGVIRQSYVEVKGLDPGVYILRIGEEAFKFVKL